MGLPKLKFNPAQIVGSAISHCDNYCDGYSGNSGGSYLLGLVLGVATAPLRLGHDDSRVLDEINTFDRAEVEETNLGQINMITVSSFCGPQGLLWGYDLVTADNLKPLTP